MERTRMQNRWMPRVPTNYIVDKRGNYEEINPIDMNVWAVIKDKYNTWDQVNEANTYGIHIEVVGDFSKEPPTHEQYEWLRKLIKSLWKYEIRYHSDFQSKNCPWELFDKNFMKETKVEKNPEWVTYSISRYYSPMQWQTRYYNKKSYEADVTMNCGKSAIGNDWCLYPANWQKLDNSMIAKVVACPKEYPLWTEFTVNWKTVKCVDRWGAIVKKWSVVRLDLRCGIWDHALDNRNTCKL